ncbi:unnamed protein product [Mytilus coruscus]|uniref:CUB domain-containing protein n=1 Tax=Mytilus coruscus TaxID=42192 RepID=A0A6J8C2P2_MYTCO|nr:unnamed protein product [Mytilus coruscus]
MLNQGLPTFYTLQCTQGNGTCRASCKENEQSAGSTCCSNFQCCQSPTCVDTLKCTQGNGTCRASCEGNEQSAGSTCCNNFQCCQPPTCIDNVNCNCKEFCDESSSISDGQEYIDINLGCCGSSKCCKPCSNTYGGNFIGPTGSFTSPNYPSNYCHGHDCYYYITAKEGSRIMIYDGDAYLYLTTLLGGPFKGQVVTTTTNKMIVNFFSDKSGFSEYGVRANVKTLSSVHMTARDP